MSMYMLRVRGTSHGGEGEGAEVRWMLRGKAARLTRRGLLLGKTRLPPVKTAALAAAPAVREGLAVEVAWTDQAGMMAEEPEEQVGRRAMAVLVAMAARA